MPKLYPTYKISKEVGKSELKIDGKSVSEVLNNFKSTLSSELAKGIESVTIIVNGKNINYLKGMDTKIEKDDEIWLISPGGGGE